MTTFARGVDDFLFGLKLIREPKLRLFVVIPLVINIFVFVGFMYGFAHFFSLGLDWLMGWLPDWGWLDVIRWLLWLVFAFLMVLLVAYAFVFVATLIGAPFYGLLAEQVENRLTGRKVADETPWKSLVLSIPRSIFREIAKLLYYVPRAIALFIVTLIPPLNTVSPILWAGFSGWTMSLEFLDYPADNHGRSIAELKQFMRRHRSRTFGFGMLTWGATLVPLLNLVAMQAAVAGGVRFWLEAEGLLVESAERERLESVPQGR